MSLHNSHACCTLPPAVAENYELKGSYQSIADTKTYITGSSESKKAVVFLYDVFGFSPQTLQGADIVAAAGYRVFVPDFFDGDYAKAEYFAPNLPKEQEEAKAQLFARIFDFKKHSDRLDQVLAGLKAEFPSVQKFAGFGFCWGGKMVSLTSGNDSPWTVGIQTSPGRVDPDDAKRITVPQIVLASKDEPADAVSAYEANLKVDHHVEVFETMVHGWMSTRADFKDSHKRAEYDRGYKLAVDFLNKHTS